MENFNDGAVPVASHRDLRVWQAAMALSESCYRVSRALPETERYGLRPQLQRAAVSIAANVAEGHARSRRAFVHHLSIALGSEAEVQTYLELILRLELVDEILVADARANARSVGRMLTALRRALLARQP